jgi:hypothetical protein
MKAVLVSCFNYYDNRLRFVEDVLIKKGYDVEYITSDFDHIEKKKYIIKRKKTTQINVIPYTKNLSVRRLLSHYFFGRNVYFEFKKRKPDLIYVMIPPNIVSSFASKYKTKNNNVKLIIDVHDLWPETFPSTEAKRLLALPFRLWGNLRDYSLPKADIVVTECELFYSKLKHILNQENSEVLYLTREKSKLKSIPDVVNPTRVNICYLGSINNIIDKDSIEQLLIAINVIKPVTLHVIGDGENREVFINSLSNVGIDIEFYGKVYDEEKKRIIFDKCSFGINMMKSSVCVGLTMKSLDYFQAGLPILNNIQADTANLVDTYNIGINVNNENIDNVANRIVNISETELLTMRSNVNEVFELFFSTQAFKNKLEKIFSII